MSTLTIVYVLLLIAGIGWVVYRISLYMRAEREREARWTKMFTDDQFKKLLARMKTGTASGNPTESSGREKEGKTGPTSGSRPKGRPS
ncbi:MAG: hypothetical protein FJ118_07315 [Deltaproteobacteria bacterium]|nr:hypothetical protein [Deltaproteobacteria bacterium]